MGNLHRFILCFLLSLQLVKCQGFKEYYRETMGKVRSTFGNLFDTEKCNDEWVTYNLTDLKEDLDRHLFGQPLVKNIISTVFHTHAKSNTPTILSFHGMPGVGKTYVIEFIVKRLYKKASASRFVHMYIGSMHFPVVKDIEKYEEVIESVIVDGVNDCPKSLFIFDEVHRLQPGVLNKISALMKNFRLKKTPNLKDAVFIFTSNTGYEAVNEKTEELIKKRGLGRDEFELKEFDHMLKELAFKEGGLEKCELIVNSYIDHYVPFLPLEKEHIVKCINAEILKGNLGDGIVYSDAMIERVIAEAIVFGPEPHNLFSQTGCKRLSQKLYMVAFNEKSKREESKVRKTRGEL